MAKLIHFSISFSSVSSSNYQNLVDLYQQILDQATVTSATSQLEELYTHADTIFDHLVLIQNTDSSTIKLGAILRLPHLIDMHKELITQGQIVQVLQSLMDLIPNENMFQIRQNICEVACYLVYNFKFLNIELLTNYASQFLQSPDLVSTGLLLWGNLLKEPVYQQENSIVFSLLSIAGQSLVSERYDDRIQGIKIIKSLWDRVLGDLNDQEYDIVNSIIQTIYNEFQSLLFEREPDDELLLMTMLVSDEILKTPPSFFDEDQQLMFLNLAIQAISNHQLNLTTRRICHSILDELASVQLIYGYLQEQLSEIIQMSVILSIQVCHAESDDNTYDFPIAFFNRISITFDEEADTIFEMFMQLAKSLIDDGGVPERQVALLIIQSIVDGIQETFSDNIETVLQFVITAGSAQDGKVFEAACRTISELIEFVSPSLSIYIEEVANYLFEYLSYSFQVGIRTLDSLFYRCDRAPSSEFFDEIINRLLSLLNNNEQTDDILSCISSAFSQLTATAEPYLQNMFPMINDILQTRLDLRGTAIEFLGRMVKVAPNAIRAELPNIIEYAIDILTVDTESSANYSAAIFFDQISLILPVSLAPFLPQIVPPLIIMLQSKPVLHTELEKNQLIKTQNIAISALSKFVGKMPSYMSEYAVSPILECISQMDINIVVLCECISYAAEGFHALGIDLTESLKMFIHQYSNSDDKDTIFSILSMLGEVLSEYGTQTSPSLLEMLAKLIPSALSGQNIYLLRAETSHCIDQQLQAPLFFFITSFVDACGSNFVEYLDIIFSTLYPNFKSSSPMMRGFSLKLASKICYNCNIHNEPFQMTLNSAITNLVTDRSKDMRKSIAHALRYLIFTYIEGVQPHFDIITRFAEELIQENEAVLLWCVMFMNNQNLPNSASFLQLAIEALPPPADSEDIAFAAIFSAFLKQSYSELIAKKLPLIAAEFFSSSDYHMKKVDNKVLITMASALNEMTEDDLLALVNSNESKLIRITTHLQQVANDLQPSQ